MSQNTKMGDAIRNLAALFDRALAPQTVAAPAQATLSAGTESVQVAPAGTVADAFRTNAARLGIEPNRGVTFAKNGAPVTGTEPVEAGAVYTATVKFDEKG